MESTNNIAEYRNFVRNNKKAILAEEGAIGLAEHYSTLALLCKRENDERQAAYFTRLASSTLRASKASSYADNKKTVINAMHSGVIPRSHVKYRWDGMSPLRVTFFASLGDMRVMRLAAAAKAAGIHVQLVVCHFNQQRDDMIDPSTYDKVVWVDSIPGDLSVVLDAIHDFDSHLVHCFMQCTANHCGVWLLAACDLPMVGDAYDMVNVQYALETSTGENRLAVNSEWEKIWLANCEGVCFRSPYKKYLQKGGVVSCKWENAIHLPEPVITKCNKQKKPTKTANILIWYYEEPSRNFFSKLESLGIFRIPDVFFYTIDCSGTADHERKIDNLTIYPTLSYNEWVTLLSLCDAYVVPDWQEVLNPLVYRQVPRYDHFGNRYPEALENDCCLILSENYRYCKNLYKTTNRTLVISPKDFFSRVFWEGLPQKLQLIRRQPANFASVNHEYAGNKLSAFYKNILLTDNNHDRVLGCPSGE